MSGDDLSDVYDIKFTPLDSTLIPVVTTAVFCYFWLKQGTDDEMPEVSNVRAIDELHTVACNCKVKLCISENVTSHD